MERTLGKPPQEPEKDSTEASQIVKQAAEGSMCSPSLPCAKERCRIGNLMPGIIQHAAVTFDGPPLSHLPIDTINALTKPSDDMSRIIAGEFRLCCLGILGVQDKIVNTETLPLEYPQFNVRMEKERQSVRLVFEQGPSNAFVEGDLTKIRKKHIAAAVRDMVFHALHFDQASTNQGRSALLETMIGDAGLLLPTKTIINDRREQLLRIVCWGGHTIGPADYGFAKRVGEELGLRYFEAITGGGPGTMRGVLRGNRKGLNQQEIFYGKQIGFTSPEIIAAEPPNVFVTDLVILPDIEMRLEAFLRSMNGIVILPGGPGTAEELFLAEAVKLHPANENQHIPMSLSCARNSVGTLHAMHECIERVLGSKATEMYEIVTGTPESLAGFMKNEMQTMRNVRDRSDDAYEWNRSMVIPNELQTPFLPTHQTMESLQLHASQELWQLCAEVRKFWKGIVYGSVTGEGRAYIREHGKFKVNGERFIIEALETLLQRFIAEKRMRAERYEPCYEFVE